MREKRPRHKTVTTSSAESGYGFSPYGNGMISKASENTVWTLKSEYLRTVYAPLKLVQVIGTGMRLLQHDRVKKSVQYFISKAGRKGAACNTEG
jgi:hypothetical protein